VTEAELVALADEIVARVAGERGERGGRAGGRKAERRHRGTAAQMPGNAVSVVPSRRAAVPLSRLSTGLHRVADLVDHTLLKAEATRADIEKLCAEAAEHGFAAVCVNPTWVELCVERLAGTPVAVATVIGFPLGATTSRAKAAEAREAVAAGAGETDMVAAVGRAKGGEWAYVEDDIRAVVEAARPAIVKVIIESAVLTPEEIVKASVISKEAGAHFVKTSTGFHAAGGASTEAVRLMRLAVGDDLGVKASGGVRDCASALAMVAAGANRLGTSSGVGFVTCLGPGPISFRELLANPQAHAHTCTSGTCKPAGGAAY
jgi:deoxyribose-phosphate aldolase